MYRTIVAGCNGRERGAAPCRLHTRWPRPPVRACCSSASTITLRFPSPARTPISARSSSTSCEPFATSSLRTRSSVWRAASRPRTRCATSLLRRTPTCSWSAHATVPGCSGWSRATRRSRFCTGRPARSRSLATRWSRVPSFTGSASASTTRPSRRLRWSWRASSRGGPAPACPCGRWSTTRSPDGSASRSPRPTRTRCRSSSKTAVRRRRSSARRLGACEGVAAEGFVVVDPAEELIAATEELDLLVLGSRRWGPVRRLALGSTSERVIHDAACPVLVPPRRTDAERTETLLATLAVRAP